MKYISTIALILTITFFSCSERASKKVTDSEIEQNLPSLPNDTIELESLTKELYKWNETRSSQIDFAPFQKEKTDSAYTRIDMTQHQQRLDELKETHFFTDEFIANYDKIATVINEKLINRSLIYLVGENPPYGNDANPWCNCQDYTDKYWEKIKLEDLKILENKATYNWTWGDNFKYKVNAVKKNGSWKISYLEGFDINEFVPKIKSN